MFSIYAAFVIGLVDNLGSDFHGVSMALAFVAALVNGVCLHGVFMFGALGGQHFESEFQYFSPFIYLEAM